MNIEVITIKGARQHNLKNLDLVIPRHQLVVFTGTSGSGKSSLAFDTLFAEGQRRYVESLSAYARQFLDQMEKPDVDAIEGLSPALAIEQRSSSANPRSTIATSTEIYDYLRLLYSAAGQPHDPATGEPVRRQTSQQIVDQILQGGDDRRIILMAPLVQGEKGEFRDVLDKIKRDGFIRARIDGQLHDLDSPTPIRLDGNRKHDIEVVVDRLILKEGVRTRLSESVETALRLGKNRLLVADLDTADDPASDQLYSTAYVNPVTGFSLPQLSPKSFSFNSHQGACPQCQGLGTQLIPDPALMISDPAEPLKAGVILPYQRNAKRLRAYYLNQLLSLARHFNTPMETPFQETSEAFRHALFHGTGKEAIDLILSEGGRRVTTRKPFEGLVPSIERLYRETRSELSRRRLRAFMRADTCPACGGSRLRPEILAVTLADLSGRELNIHQLCALTVDEALHFMKQLALSESQRTVVAEVNREIHSRLQFLADVGLGYLQLNRRSATLSGGEAQRIRLATQIGSGLAGVLYVLDEPSIGLHQRDNRRLIETLFKLRDLGNSVIVVEHDEETIRAADHVVDLGPGAGPRGGRVVAQGGVDQIAACEQSLTGQYLSGRAQIGVPKRRVAPRSPFPLDRSSSPRPSPRPASRMDGSLAFDAEGGWLIVRGASENNLRHIDAAFPLGCMICVTGVSGSGKSTLVDDILRRALFRHLHRSKDQPGAHESLAGLREIDKAIVIDQAPIGKTPRSNAATYTGAFNLIRDLFSQLPLSRVRGYDPGRFSFNVRGGRCEHCQGDGFLKIDMHFLSDVYVPCEVCHGKRYNRETLEVTYKGHNIADILDLTIDEAERFFRTVPGLQQKLRALAEVGLGYLRLGQPGTNLSGGEAQRIKLAAELARKSTGRTVYILDEPTTGLHFHDIEKLLEVLLKLRDAGNTVMIIEHNLEVIKCADWILDLGPEGGLHGGAIIAQGTPEEVAETPGSHTGRFLKPLLHPLTS